MKVSVLLVLVSAVHAAPPARTGVYQGHNLVSVKPENVEQVSWLEKLREQDERVDFWSSPHLNHDVYIRVTPEAQPEMQRLFGIMGMRYDLKVDNLQTLVDLEASEPSGRSHSVSGRSHSAVGRYVKSDQIFDFVHMLSNNNYMITEKSIGKSYEGRDLLVTKYSSGGKKPAIFVNSGMHSREWIAHASIVWIMNELADKYGVDSSITALLNKYDVYIMPLVNPDGYDYSHTGERFWRKTRSHNGISSKCMGTDPNRNFDIEFGGEGTSGNPCSDIYRGPHAFSEPETAALVAFLQSIPELVMYIDVHSFSQLWLTPYAYTHERPPDAKELDRVAEIGAKAIKAINGNKFTVGTAPSILYIATGGSDDYAKAVLGIKYAYTMELRPANGGIFGFIVPADQIPDSGRETMAGIIAAAMAIEI